MIFCHLILSISVCLSILFNPFIYLSLSILFCLFYFRYIGIKGLAAIVNDHPRYAADHQLAVIDCLEDSDETLRRKTVRA